MFEGVDWVSLGGVGSLFSGIIAIFALIISIWSLKIQYARHVEFHTHFFDGLLHIGIINRCKYSISIASIGIYISGRYMHIKYLESTVVVHPNDTYEVVFDKSEMEKIVNMIIKSAHYQLNDKSWILGCFAKPVGEKVDIEQIMNNVQYCIFKIAVQLSGEVYTSSSWINIVSLSNKDSFCPIDDAYSAVKVHRTLISKRSLAIIEAVTILLASISLVSVEWFVIIACVFTESLFICYMYYRAVEGTATKEMCGYICVLIWIIACFYSYFVMDFMLLAFMSILLLVIVSSVYRMMLKQCGLSIISMTNEDVVRDYFNNPDLKMIGDEGNTETRNAQNRNVRPVIRNCYNRTHRSCV